MLEIQNLTAGYPGHPVLRDLSLSLPRGQVTVIAGPNGCGKSTLLKALAGLIPTEGRICLDGQDLAKLTPKERAQKIACLPQNRQVPEITVQRLVLHGRFPYLGYPRRYRAEDLAAARAALARLGLEALADRPLTALSGGQRQKAYLAMVLAQDTPVVLLDEPNTFLDIPHQQQMMALARQLAAEGKTVVMVLHDLALALETADCLVVMENGCIRCRGTAEAVLACGCLQQIFGLEVKGLDTEDGRKYYYKSAWADSRLRPVRPVVE